MCIRDRLLVLALALILLSCGDDGERVCDQNDYTGLYQGSKEGALCNNDSNLLFEVSAGPNNDEIIVDGNLVNFLGCAVVSASTTLGLGEEWEGSLNGDSITVVQTALGGIVEISCTWRGTKQ